MMAVGFRQIFSFVPDPPKANHPGTRMLLIPRTKSTLEMKHLFFPCLLLLLFTGLSPLVAQEVTGPMLPSAQITGGVITERGEEVEDVQVSVMGYVVEDQTTGQDGHFGFTDMPLDHNYTLSAARDEARLNGVNTLDLILMVRHVLGTARLDSPYKMIAADVDRSGHISTLDIIQLRRLLLGNTVDFPGGNAAWRFVDASYVFPDPSNPFATYFPEMYHVGPLEADMSQADFVAVKVGDVDGSARTNTVYRPEAVTSAQTAIEFMVEDQEVTAGEWVDITFRAAYLNELRGYQFTLEFNPNALEVQEILAGDVPNMFPEENFGRQDLAEGILTTLWHEYDQRAVGRESILFTLHCRVKQSGHLRDWLYLGSRHLTAEAYLQNGQTQAVALAFTQPDQLARMQTGFELFQNRPNPWQNETIIPFQLDTEGTVRLRIFDVAGKLVYTREGAFGLGYHELGIERNDLPATGVFYYMLEANGFRATRRMVLTN
jgi:hypothetical protein